MALYRAPDAPTLKQASYDEGRAYTEGEHRTWLAEAGFSDVEVQWGAAPGGASLITARKVG
jgi:hypothetical protein